MNFDLFLVYSIIIHFSTRIFDSIIVVCVQINNLCLDFRKIVVIRYSCVSKERILEYNSSLHLLYNTLVTKALF